MGLESREEKCRVAAKGRRDGEKVQLDQLAELLPVSEEVRQNLDKGAILRMTICYLQMKQYMQNGGAALLDEVRSNQTVTVNGVKIDEGQLMLEALNGFLIFTNSKGTVIYVSEQVTQHLGLNQSCMMKKNISEFLHRDDQKEFLKQFQESTSKCGNHGSRLALPSPVDVHMVDEDPDLEDVDPSRFVRERLFYVRMKCYVTRKGSKTKQTGFLLVQWSGRLILQQEANSSVVKGLIAVCRPMQSTPILEIRLDGNMFMSRHDLGMKFTFCDPRIITLIGYEPSEVLGKTAYQFHNPLDAGKIHNCHSTLIMRGSSVSKYYRFLGKTSEWVWMQTRATIIYNTSNEPQYIVCMNYMIGEEEGNRFLMLEQENAADRKASSVPGYSMEVITSSGEASPRYSSSGDESYHHTDDNSQDGMEAATASSFEQINCTANSHACWTDHSYSQAPGASMCDAQAGLNGINNGLHSPALSYASSNTSGGADSSEFANISLHSDIFSDDEITTFLPPQMYRQTNSAHITAATKQAPYSQGLNNFSHVKGSISTNPFSGDGDDIDSVEPKKKSKRTVPGMSVQAGVNNTALDSENSTSSILASLLGTMRDKPTLAKEASTKNVVKILASNVPTSRTVNWKPVSVSVDALPGCGFGFTGENNSDFTLKLANTVVDQQVSMQLGEFGMVPLQQQQQQQQQQLQSTLCQQTLNPASTATYHLVPSADISNSRCVSTTNSSASPHVVNVSGVVKNTVVQGGRHLNNACLVGGGNGPREGQNTTKVNGHAVAPNMNHGHRTPSNGRVPGASLLAQFLTSKETPDPNKGSDEAFTSGLSQLNLNEHHNNHKSARGHNMLEKMLMGDMNPNDVHRMQQDVIENRQQSSAATSPEPTPPPSHDFSPFDLDGPGDMGNLTGTGGLGMSFDPFLDDGPAVPEDMEFGLDQSLMEMMQSDLDEVLQEQTRYGNSWLEHFGIT